MSTVARPKRQNLSLRNFLQIPAPASFGIRQQHKCVNESPLCCCTRDRTLVTRPLSSEPITALFSRYSKWDLALFKDKRLTEKVVFTFRVELFNLFNRVQFGGQTPASEIVCMGASAGRLTIPACCKWLDVLTSERSYQRTNIDALTCRCERRILLWYSWSSALFSFPALSQMICRVLFFATNVYVASEVLNCYEHPKTLLEPVQSFFIRGACH